MQRVDFYYDPSCPFCWVTSRWLVQVSAKRDIDVTWRPFSLAIKNDELPGGASENSGHSKGHNAGHRVLRVIAAAEKEGADAGGLYTVFGAARHVDGTDFTDELISEILADSGLSADLLKAADDDSWDEHLNAELKSALDLVGDDVGVPIIAFEREDGTKQGYFGPVILTLPEEEESLAMWDGLSNLATVETFYELKRTRPAGGPDTQSTKGL